jgi:hypothetical protein
MGTGAGGYVKITLQTLLSSYDRGTDQIHRISELLFTSAPTPDDPQHQPPADINTAKPGPPPAALPAGKLGLGGVKPGDVVKFNLFARMDDDTLAGMGVAMDRGITDELQDAFGGKWAGFAVALAPAGAKFRLVADITLKVRWKHNAKRPFQVIPIVMAFGTDRFVDHYLLAVIAAQHTVEKVDTSVVQSYQ